MKFFLKYLCGMLLFIGLATAGLIVQGCQNGTPDNAVILTEANDTLAATETILTALDKQHAIPAADRPVVASAIYVAQRDIAAANAAGSGSATASVLAQIRADLDAAVTLRLKYATPTTQPNK